MKSTTIRIEDETLDRIDSMAKSLSRSRSWIINQAIERFLSNEEWFVREVEAGLDEARKGDLAAPEEVTARFGKWGVNAD
ncbi:MAG: ribbon-helix-helix protein, CopG family [Proteobacteria bacterium]|nr:ribbon-helix-helix protein, CopG family [Pseudomonadota bacterium]